MTPQLDRALRNHAFVRGLNDVELETLAELATEVSFAEAELILTSGQRSKWFYLLIAGSVAVELRAPRYTVCVQALGPGEVFGWSSLLDEHNTLFQVRAREWTSALRFDGAALQAKCRSDAHLGASIFHRALQVVAGRVRATELRFAEMCGVRV